jgi:hypothetical protein
MEKCKFANASKECKNMEGRTCKYRIYGDLQFEVSDLNGVACLLNILVILLP